MLIARNNTTRGIFYILIAMSVFSIHDALIKLLAEESASLFQILFFRSLLGMTIILLYLKFKGQKFILKTNYPLLTFIRCFLFLLGFSLFYACLKEIPLAIATVLFFASPFFLTIMSKLFLKESVGIRRWSAVIIGFLGIFLIVDPDLDKINIYMIFPVLCALCYSTSIIILKKTDKDNVFTQTFQYYIFAALTSGLLGLLVQTGVISSENANYDFFTSAWFLTFNMNFFFIILIGIFGAIGLLVVFSAYRIAPPQVIAPFEYILIVWAILIGWIFWNEIPDIKSIIGIALVTFGGFYVFYRESVKDTKVAVDKPIR